jgi:phosphate/sulfate permease
MYQIPKKTIFKVGEVLMNALFISFSAIFIWLFITNLTGYLSSR